MPKLPRDLEADDLLFVYGTLRTGQGQSLATFQGGARLVDKDRINGKIYNMGWYPGLVEPQSGVFKPKDPAVVGEVFALPNAWLGKQLDQYEGFPNLYNRCVVTTEQGYDVWVYTYNHAVAESFLIPSGDWMNKPLIVDQEAANAFAALA